MGSGRWWCCCTDWERKEDGSLCWSRWRRNTDCWFPTRSGSGDRTSAADYSIQTYVDFLNEFLPAIESGEASLVGESLGGWIAGLYVQRSRRSALDTVEKLVLVDAAGLKQIADPGFESEFCWRRCAGLMEAVFLRYELVE